MGVFLKNPFIREEDLNDYGHWKHFFAVSKELALSLTKMPKEYENTFKRVRKKK
jgi:hypothetical protein